MTWDSMGINGNLWEAARDIVFWDEKTQDFVGQKAMRLQGLDMAALEAAICGKIEGCQYFP